MERRDFIKTMFYATTALGTAGLSSFPFSNAVAANPVTNRTLVNIMLSGGADLRYLFIPAPGSRYAEKFWEARKSLYSGYSTYQSLWDEPNPLYLETVSNGETFGIHSSAGWLKAQFDLGNVSIISNVISSDNRRHDHSQLIMHAGDSEANQYLYDRAGWGGRLVEAIMNNNSDSANVVAIGHDVSVFCNGSNAGNRLQNLIHSRDTRNFALDNGLNEDNFNPKFQRNILGRALRSYYTQAGNEAQNKIDSGEKSANWPYRKFFQHEKQLREFGGLIKERLDANLLPIELTGLLEPATYTTTEIDPATGTFKQVTSIPLYNKTFAQECANLYDSMLASDILKLRVAYMEYTGWDDHKKIETSFVPRINDMFGIGKGLDVLQQSLEADIAGANDNLTYVLTSDFGRQLKANGDKGTDHGSGTYTIVIGNSVQGGIHGEMFPASEVEGTDGATKFEEDLNHDILGQTSFERVLGEICNWVEPGSGINVFPRTALNGQVDEPIIEPGVDLSTLFKPA